jgi:uncharacterized protein
LDLYIYRIQLVRQEMLSEGSTPEEDRIIEDHFRYLERLTQEGVVRLAGRTLSSDGASFGIVILSADSEDSAEAVVREDPAVKGQVMRAELFPFRIALLGDLTVSSDGD